MTDKGRFLSFETFSLDATAVFTLISQESEILDSFPQGKLLGAAAPVQQNAKHQLQTPCSIHPEHKKILRITVRNIAAFRFLIIAVLQHQHGTVIAFRNLNRKLQVVEYFELSL